MNPPFLQSHEQVMRGRPQDAEVGAFFLSLGYTLSWDHRNGVMWHEVYDKKSLVCQIDMGIPLAVIKRDLISLHKGEPMGEEDYAISTDSRDDPGFEELLRKVANGR